MPVTPSASTSAEDLMKKAHDALYTKNNGAEAEAYLRTLLARSPSHYGGLYHLAVALETCGRIMESRALWREVLAIADRSGDEDTKAAVLERMSAYDW